LVDYSWHRGPSCHLIADSVAELIAFAEQIGLRRDWFQPKSSPHFDLTAAGRRDRKRSYPAFQSRIRREDP
jgi:hypothetical protein